MLGGMPAVPDRPTDPDVEATPAAVPPVLLVSGPEEFLAERAVERVTAAARSTHPDLEVRRLAGADLEPGALLELTSPSLFGETILLVVDSAHELPAEAAAELAAIIRNPPDDVHLVVVHPGPANRAKPVLDACKSAKVPEVSAVRMTRVSERLDFVRAEARADGRQLTDDAARALVDAVGSDLRELAAATAQLVSDTEGAITPDVVARYYAGRAEVTSFQVADLAVEGRTSEALGQLRWALGSGVAPVLVTSALASALRSIGRVASAPRGAKAADLARDLGMPPWKVDVVRRQIRGWDGAGLARAIAAVSAADGAVKGINGAGDAAYALEKAVLEIGAARTAVG
jgi:DNA polymerase-3 subunit delta